jgi:dTDP-4-dehydrorhamnose reductase
MNSNILVLGAAGQLGQCIMALSKERNLNEFIFPDKDVGDILDKTGLKNLFEQYKPAFIINCAAYTAVDRAEDDIDLCRKVNAEGVLNIASLCKHYNSTMIHVSTDFVFKGDRPFLLKEVDIPNPVNVYGRTKLEGEIAITDGLEKYYILRTSWLYSEHGNNFVKTMLKLAESRSSLSIIADQIGTPTYAVDLAGAILSIIDSGKRDYGIYHYSNEGITSWYDFAVGIFDLSNLKIKVNPISTAEYPTRAVRPPFSVMDKSKIKSAFDIEIPYWRTSLSRCIGKLDIQDSQ